MGNAQGVPGAAGPVVHHTPTQGFTPSDGFFLIDAAKQGNLEVIGLFLKKNPALVRGLHLS